MSNVFYGTGCTYFQFPEQIITSHQLAEMNASELKLLLVILQKAQRHTRTDLTVSNAELLELAGIQPNSARTARENLRKQGLLDYRRDRGGVYRYTLLNPEAGGLLWPEGRRPGQQTTEGTRSSATRKPTGKSLYDLTPEQYRRYFETRLEGQAVASGNQVMACCPFHDDNDASMSLNFERGQWHCFTCENRGDSRGGGLIAFEIALSKCDPKTAFKNIASIINDPELYSFKVEPETVYTYTDEDGEVLFEVERYPGKGFAQRRPGANGRYVYNIEGVRRVLYRLPELIAATYVITCEGEKDADRVRELALRAPDGSAYAVTTNPGGVGKWRDEYTRFFKGKKVIILADCDDAGLKHAEQVSDAVSEVAVTNGPVANWDIGCKDVSDYLDRHSPDELMEKIGANWFAEVITA